MATLPSPQGFSFSGFRQRSEAPGSRGQPGGKTAGWHGTGGKTTSFVPRAGKGIGASHAVPEPKTGGHTANLAATARRTHTALLRSFYGKA